MKDYINSEATIKTDKWTAYKNLQDDFTNHTSVLSSNKKNFQQLHRCIIMLKTWLRGVHHSVRDLQPYLNEYCYQYIRHLMKRGIFENLTQRMILHKPVFYKNIRYTLMQLQFINIDSILISLYFFSPYYDPFIPIIDDQLTELNSRCIGHSFSCYLIGEHITDEHAKSTPASSLNSIP